MFLCDLLFDLSADAFVDDFPQCGLNRDGVLNEQNLLEELPEGELPKNGPYRLDRVTAAPP